MKPSLQTELISSGPGNLGNFFTTDWQTKLQSTDAENESTRKIIYGRLRLPDLPSTRSDRRGQAFPYFMPWLSGGAGTMTIGEESTFSSLTELQYERLSRWADGHFTVDPHNRPNPPRRFEDIPLAQQPAALTRANLEWTVGAPLFPGVELSWNMNLDATYDLRPEAVARKGTLGWRINESVLPGDLTKFLGVPWQSNFYTSRNFCEQIGFA